MGDYNLIQPTPAIDNFATGASIAVVIAVIVGALLVLALIALIVVANCKIFKKAGEAWWKGLIPLYNSWVETKIVGLAWWWFIIYFVLIALIQNKTGDNYNAVIFMGLVLVSFNYSYNLAKRFGKSNGFAVLTTILPIIGLPILAFGSAQYDKSVKVDENGVFSIKKEKESK